MQSKVSKIALKDPTEFIGHATGVSNTNAAWSYATITAIATPIRWAVGPHTKKSSSNLWDISG